MSHRPFLAKASLLFATTALVIIVTLGGCPVAQTPGTTNENQNDNTARNNVDNNQRPGNRPVPPIPVDNDNGGGTGPGTGTGDNVNQNLNVNTNTNDNGGTTERLTVVVTTPQTNREVLRNQAVEVDYRVDGAAESVELVFAKDDGDVQVAQAGLSLEGTVVFSTFEPGTYVLGIRAQTSLGATKLQLAPGKITVVGDMDVVITEPAIDRIVRPGVPVAVAYNLTTLAKAVNVSVFLDPNRNVDGDEVLQFTSKLKADSRNIQTQNLTLGQNYSLYIEATDSVGQNTGRIYNPHIIRVVPTPTINVTAPANNATIQPGDDVNVEFAGFDTEGVAVISVFVDTDGVFNGDEEAIVEGLAIGTTSAVINTATFQAGTYFFGAWVSDAVTGDVFDYDYAPGTRVIPGITISGPTTDQSVRSPTAVRITWTAIYPTAQFPTHQVVIAPDVNNDKQPDGPLTVLAGGFNPGSNSFNLSTLGLKGRYVAGVRLTDTAGQSITSFAQGGIVVNNDPPALTLQAPNAFLGVRPGSAAANIVMSFTATDTEGVLASPGIEIVIARDDDFDGLPDGAPVYTETSGQLRLGFNPFYVFNASKLAAQGLINDPVHNQFGMFLLGVRVTDDAGQVRTVYANGGLYLDAIEPTIDLTDPTINLTRDRIGTFDVTLRVTDTSPTLVGLLLDKNISLQDGFDAALLPVDAGNPTIFGPNQTRTFTFDLSSISAGYYFYRLFVTDGAGSPVEHYLPKNVQSAENARSIWIRDRLIGNFNLSSLLNPPPGQTSQGAILQGFNFNDLAGSSMTGVPDVDGDGDDELLIVSRYGKPYIINNNIGVGFGEAYMIYGNGGRNVGSNPDLRLKRAQTLNAVGRGSIAGLSFPGIRVSFNSTWTEGISDVAVLSDMDGDRLPELVFSFPRVESLNLGAPAFVNGIPHQHPELLFDITGMGDLEYDAIDYNPMSATYGQFLTNPPQSQFTRGGIVIVSSHNSNFSNAFVLNRKADRVIDLHEIGQMFSSMQRPSLQVYPASFSPDLNHPQGPSGCGYCPLPGGQSVDCNTDGTIGEFSDQNGNGTWGDIAAERLDIDGDGTRGERFEGPYQNWVVVWDAVFGATGGSYGHGPGGFHMPWTQVPANPPLANPSSHPPLPPYIFYPNFDKCNDINGDGLPDGCGVRNVPIFWFPQPLGGPFPCSNRNNVLMWDVGGGVSHWTGFYGGGAAGPEVTIRDFSVGARVLGQRVEDRFGTAVGTDGTWLFITAPRHTALHTDVPALGSTDRVNCGVAYQYRIDSRASINGRTRSQLWMEPFSIDTNNDGTADTPARWPVVDAEGAKPIDTTMPVPHQYIIEDVGSTRGPNTPSITYNVLENSSCPPSFPAITGGDTADAASSCYQPYSVGTAGYYMDRTPQIVGPHRDARISFVRGLGDVNDDGIRDFAIGSPDIRENFVNTPNNPTGNVVGGIFIVYSRPTGLEGDYLLDDLARDPTDPRRLSGVFLRGTANEPIARVIDAVGIEDKNEDGKIDDFNGDGVGDVIVGSSTDAANRGEAIVILGSRTLISPLGGFTLDQIVAENRAIRFRGARAGDFAGANVAGAGDVDGDGLGDILIAAPGASLTGVGPKPGLTYLIYGSAERFNSGAVIDLALVGTPALPGVVFVGRNDGDFLGGGDLSMVVNPDGLPTSIFSRGLSALGDIDGDGRADYGISAILADPASKQNAGEVYVIYGRGDVPEIP